MLLVDSILQTACLMVFLAFLFEITWDDDGNDNNDGDDNDIDNDDDYNNTEQADKVVSYNDTSSHLTSSRSLAQPQNSTSKSTLSNTQRILSAWKSRPFYDFLRISMNLSPSLSRIVEYGLALTSLPIHTTLTCDGLFSSATTSS